MAKIVQAYSYKGGSGRTVATANIATILAAEFNKKVVCIDLDIESAGMSMVLGLYDEIKNSKEQYYIQDVLLSRGFKNDKDFKARWPKLHINLGTHWNNNRIGDRFSFVPARAAFQLRDSDLVFAEEEAGSIDSLLRKINLFIEPDFIFFDSASGLTDPATIGMSFANILLVFFRWNNQFVTGTIDVMNEVISKQLDEFDDTLKYVMLIPSAVPNVKTEAMDYSHLLRASTNRIKTALRLDQDDKTELKSGIPEAVGLKWQEKILALNTITIEDEKAAYNAYKEIAESLINKNL